MAVMAQSAIVTVKPRYDRNRRYCALRIEIATESENEEGIEPAVAQERGRKFPSAVPLVEI